MVKLRRPLGACHAVKIKIHLHVHSHMLLLLRKYASTYIHSFPSPEPPKSILLLIQERIAKNILLFLFQEMSALKKEKKENKKIRGNKKGQVLGTSKKRKSEMRGKNGQVSDSRIRGTRHPPERKEKENIEHLIPLKKLQSARKVCIPLKEQK